VQRVGLAIVRSMRIGPQYAVALNSTRNYVVPIKTGVEVRSRSVALEERANDRFPRLRERPCCRVARYKLSNRWGRAFAEFDTSG
jgi:hypothetical protein